MHGTEHHIFSLLIILFYHNFDHQSYDEFLSVGDRIFRNCKCFRSNSIHTGQTF